MIELNEISKTFVERSWRATLRRRPGRRVRALRGVSLTVGRGEVFGLLGPNGAGKTTLIKLLATLILPDTGSGRVCGHDLNRAPGKVRKKIGLVNTSERSFYWRLTGRQNLDFFAALWGLSGEKRKKRIHELLDLTDLGEKADTQFMKYSTGQQQRLAVARALLSHPQVLLMDEPTRSLDPMAASALRRLARDELAGRQDKTVLWCTHNLKEAEEVCDRLAIIHEGSVIASGTLNEMQALMDDRGVYRLKINRWPEGASEKLGIIPLRAFRNNGHVELELREKEEQIPFILKDLLDNDIQVYNCTHVEHDLERVFERLIGHG